jgi:GTPase SAR1 family protein
MKPELSKGQERYDFMVKVVIVGESSVGKTNILSRFSDD